MKKFGQPLIEQGIITEEQLELALEAQQTAKKKKLHLSLGWILANGFGIAPSKIERSFIAEAIHLLRKDDSLLEFLQGNAQKLGIDPHFITKADVYFFYFVRTYARSTVIIMKNDQLLEEERVVDKLDFHVLLIVDTAGGEKVKQKAVMAYKVGQSHNPRIVKKNLTELLAHVHEAFMRHRQGQR